MAATQPKSTKSTTTDTKVFRAKVTGRHAITLPAELCRQLGIEVGDSVELVLNGDSVELRPMSDAPVLPISALRGILKPYFPDATRDSIRAYLEEEREGWDEREAAHDRIWEKKWPKGAPSSG